MDQLRESYSALLFEQIIRVDSRLQNAQWENRPCWTTRAVRVSRRDTAP